VSYKLQRLKTTALRLKWVVLALVVLGAAGGFFGMRLVDPVFTATATILVSKDGQEQGRGPIRDAGVLETQGWVDVLRSSRVVDSVVLRTGDHIRAGSREDRALLQGATTAPDYVAGAYVIKVDATGAAYTLLADVDGAVLETGTLPDSVGRKVGLRWTLDRQPGERDIEIYLARVRDAAEELRENLRTFAHERAQFVTVELDGANPDQLATTLNVWMTEFVTVAGELKRRRASEYLSILEQQVQLAQDRLRTAEGALETLRASALTSSTGGGSMAGGLEATRDPLMREFLSNRISLEEVRRDRDNLTQMLRDPNGLSVEGLQALPNVLSTNAALRTALTDLSTLESRLRSQRQFYGEEHSSVRELVASIDVMKRQTLPQLVRSALDQLSFREQTLSRTVGSFSAELQRVPERSIEEARRRREVSVAEALYTSVLSRYNEVRLGSAALGADVQIFDNARASRFPSQNPRRRVLAGGAVAGLFLAALLVFLVDLTDHRVRYAQQVTGDLRLDILGYVPHIDQRGRTDPLAAAQAVEAFRSLRLRLQNEVPRGSAFSVVLTSPGIGDGKSLVTQNLAMSCAQAGLRTLLIDGDIRRGRQHATFGVPQAPGLVDVLERDADPQEAIVPTEVPNLLLLPAGSRHKRVPELLDREKLQHLLDRVRGHFDAIVVDAAPLGAGIDAFALGVACGTMALVLRMDHSDARMAQNKLDVLDRLPVRVIGAILNDISSSSNSMYTPYYDEYMLAEDPPTPAKSPSKGKRARVTSKT
jgi:capsular exopolysaccharide synthesis family protein